MIGVLRRCRAADARPGRPAGLLEKLIAAVRPQFRTDVLVFDPRDPVFGGPACAGRLSAARPQAGPVPGSLRAVAGRGETGPGGVRRRYATGHGRLPPASRMREIAGCLYGQTARGICERHRRQWRRAARSWCPGARPRRRRPHPGRLPAGWATATCGRARRRCLCAGGAAWW